MVKTVKFNVESITGEQANFNLLMYEDERLRHIEVRLLKSFAAMNINVRSLRFTGDRGNGDIGHIPSMTRVKDLKPGVIKVTKSY